MYHSEHSDWRFMFSVDLYSGANSLRSDVGGLKECCGGGEVEKLLNRHTAGLYGSMDGRQYYIVAQNSNTGFGLFGTPVPIPLSIVHTLHKTMYCKLTNAAGHQPIMTRE